MNNLIATVAVEKTFFSTDSDFDYIIPVSLINNVKIGSMVKVPFGNGNKVRNSCKYLFCHKFRFKGN